MPDCSKVESSYAPRRKKIECFVKGYIAQTEVSLSCKAPTNIQPFQPTQATCSPKLRGLCGNFSSRDNEGGANGAFESDNGNSTDNARHGSSAEMRQGDQGPEIAYMKYIWIKYIIYICINMFCIIYLKICFIDFDWTGWLQLSIFSSIDVFPQSNAWSFSVAHSCALEEWSVISQREKPVNVVQKHTSFHTWKLFVFKHAITASEFVGSHPDRIPKKVLRVPPLPAEA